MTDAQDNKTSAQTPETGAGQAQRREAQPESGFDALQRRALLFTLIVLAVGLGLAALVVSGGYLAYRHGAPKVVATVPAGRVLGVQLHGGLFSSALVETDIGFYSLEEGVSFLKGGDADAAGAGEQEPFPVRLGSALHPAVAPVGVGRRKSVPLVSAICVESMMDIITIVQIALGAVIVAGVLFGVYVSRKNKALLAENQDWLQS